MDWGCSVPPPQLRWPGDAVGRAGWTLIWWLQPGCAGKGAAVKEATRPGLGGRSPAVSPFLHSGQKSPVPKQTAAQTIAIINSDVCRDFSSSGAQQSMHKAPAVPFCCLLLCWAKPHWGAVKRPMWWHCRWMVTSPLPLQSTRAAITPASTKVCVCASAWKATSVTARGRGTSGPTAPHVSPWPCAG